MDAAAWRAKQEEEIRLAVPRDIERLRKEAAANLAQADQLEAMLREYPSIRKYTGRWNKVAYYAKEANVKVTRFDVRHNCGCCQDSPLEIWPYLETPHGNVYSDPPKFVVGEKSYLGGDRPYEGWDATMRAACIPEVIISEVRAHFERCAKEAREAVEQEYGDG